MTTLLDNINAKGTNVQCRNVLILTGDPLGKKMAGPGIRAYNFAQQLSSHHNLVLATTNNSSLDNPDFKILKIENKSDFRDLENWADIIIIQGNIILEFPELMNSQKYVVCDLYDPMHLEQLEQGVDPDINLWNRRIAHANHILSLQITIGDFFIAASERQRDFWLGSFALSGRVNAKTYLDDSSLFKLIGIVPFGLPEQPPILVKERLRGVIPGIDKDDKIIIWGGGIYNWFDPLTLIKAMKILSISNPEIKLFFMGTQHPHPGVPEMEVLNKTWELAKELGLENRNVFFNSSWVDYHERGDYLASANVGISTHFDHLETRFSFRTRILDYLWAGIPIVTTAGDTFAALVQEEGLGVVVPECDDSILAEAILTMAMDNYSTQQIRERVLAVSKDFTWPNVTQPLLAFCDSPNFAPDRTVIGEHGFIIKKTLPPNTGPFLQLRKKMYNLKYRFLSEGLQGIWSLFLRKIKTHN